MEVIPFFPYPKIASSTSEWNLDDASTRALERASWIASEKIHGANLCILCDGGDIAVAKRRALLEPSDPFFGYKRALGPLLPGVRGLHTRLARPGQWLLLYGELYGGTYDHPDIEAVEGAEPVQLGVSYCPEVRFAAFDAALADGDGRRFLPWSEVSAALAEANIDTAPVLGIGTLGELSRLPERFESHVPSALGLPRIAENWAGGMVLKPLERVVDLPGRIERPVLKRKIAAFSELSPPRTRPRRPPLDSLSRVEELMMPMLNAPRIASAISKIGPGSHSTGRSRRRGDPGCSRRNGADRWPADALAIE